MSSRLAGERWSFWVIRCCRLSCFRHRSQGRVKSLSNRLLHRDSDGLSGHLIIDFLFPLLDDFLELLQLERLDDIIVHATSECLIYKLFSGIP